MDFNLTDEQELLVESINEFVARNFTEEKIAEWYLRNTAAFPATT